MKRLLCALMSTTLLSAFTIFPLAAASDSFVTVNPETASGVSQNIEFKHTVEVSYLATIEQNITVNGTDNEQISLIKSITGVIPTNKSLQVRSYPSAESTEVEGEIQFVKGDPSDNIDLYLDNDKVSNPDQYVRLTFNVENRGSDPTNDTGTVARYIYDKNLGNLKNILGSIKGTYSNTGGRPAGTYVGTTVFAMELVDYTA